MTAIGHHESVDRMTAGLREGISKLSEPKVKPLYQSL